MNLVRNQPRHEKLPLKTPPNTRKPSANATAEPPLNTGRAKTSVNMVLSATISETKRMCTATFSLRTE